MPETDTVVIPAPAQASAQVLDVGDVVSAPAWQGLSGRCIIHRKNPQTGFYHIVADVDDAEGWLPREEITRAGGDLQVGDWVRVQGRIEPTRTCDWTDVANAIGIIVDVYEGADVDFAVAIPELNDLFECRTDHLTRITRAEALA